MHRADRFPRAAFRVWAALFLPAFFCFDVWSWGRVFDWIHLRITADLLLITPLALWLIILAIRRRRLTAGPMDLPLAVLLIATAVSAIAAGSRGVAAEPLLFLATLVVWLKVLEQEQRGPTLLIGILAASAGLAARVVVEFVRWYAAGPGTGPGTSWLSTGLGPVPPHLPQIGLETGATAIGGFLAMLLPVAIANFAAARRDRTRLLLAGWVLLGGLALLLVQSRSGWLAAAAGCLAVLTLLRTPGLAFWRRPGPVLVTGLVVGGLLAAAIILTVLRKGASTLERVYIWWEALQIWRAGPLWGMGPGGFTLAQFDHRPDYTTEYLVMQAHSLPVHLLTVLGVVGLAAAVWLFARAVLATIRAWRGTAPEDRPRIAGVIGGAIALLAWNLADVQSYSFMLWGTASALLACLLPRPEVKRAGRAYALCLAGLGVGLAGGFSMLEAGHLPVPQAAALLAEGRHTEARALLHSAAQGQEAAFYRWQEALLVGRGEDWRAADGIYQASDLGRAWPSVAANAAVTARHTGDGERARQLAAQAWRRAPQEARYPLLLGRQYELDGRLREAAEAYGWVLALQPAWAGSHYWTEPERRVRLSEAIEAGLQNIARDHSLVPGQRAVLEAGLHLAAGDFEAVERAASDAATGLQAQSPMAPDAVRDVLRPAGQDVPTRGAYQFGAALPLLDYYRGMAAIATGTRDTASAHFSACLQRSPGFGLCYVGLSAVARGRGAHEDAVRWARAAVVYDGGRAAHAELGRALLAAGRPRDAVPYLESGSRALRYYSTWPSLLLYKRRELLPNLLPEVRDLAPDGEIEALRRDLSIAIAATGDR